MQLIKGDCLEVMRGLIADGVKVDAVITDPPYGTTACKWDSVIPFVDMWECLNGLTRKRSPVVLFGSEPFSSALRMSNVKNYKYDWVWNKKNISNPMLAKYQPLKNHENVIIFSKGTSNYNPIKTQVNVCRQWVQYSDSSIIASKTKGNRGVACGLYPKSIIEFSNAKRKGKVHPTQKPVALMEYLIKTYTDESDTVLDFTMGSGTTGVACANLDRDFIGVERDSEYFKIAEQRITEAQNTERQTVFA